jgi:DNA-binding transcriptional regulator YiaG
MFVFGAENQMHEVSEKMRLVQSVTGLVGLVKKGDCSSLSLLRNRLGRSRAELAVRIFITESRMAAWEENLETPTTSQMALWRVKLSDYLTAEIRSILNTDNEELLSHFWDLLWRLA